MVIGMAFGLMALGKAVLLKENFKMAFGKMELGKMVNGKVELGKVEKTKTVISIPKATVLTSGRKNKF